MRRSQRVIEKRSQMWRRRSREGPQEEEKGGSRESEQEPDVEAEKEPRERRRNQLTRV